MSFSWAKIEREELALLRGSVPPLAFLVEELSWLVSCLARGAVAVFGLRFRFPFVFLFAFSVCFACVRVC